MDTCRGEITVESFLVESGHLWLSKDLGIRIYSIWCRKTIFVVEMMVNDFLMVRENRQRDLKYLQRAIQCSVTNRLLILYATFRCVAFHCCPAQDSINLPKLHTKHLLLVFKRRCKGTFSFLRWWHIFHAIMANNLLENRWDLPFLTWANGSLHIYTCSCILFLIDCLQFWGTDCPSESFADTCHLKDS